MKIFDLKVVCENCGARKVLPFWDGKCHIPSCDECGGACMVPEEGQHFPKGDEP